MNTGISWIDNLASWPFLNEPLYRWFLFAGALIAIQWGWHGALEFMH